MEKQLFEILENFSEAFLTIDRRWAFRYLNRKAEQLLKRPREELLGRQVWDVFPEARGSSFESHYSEALRDGKPTEFEEFYAPLGIWFSVRAYPTSLGLAVYFVDITQKKQERIQLEESEQRFRLLAKATNDALWDWNAVTGALWCNDGFRSLFGDILAPRSSLLAIWRENVHPDDYDRVASTIQQTVEQRCPDWVDEFRSRRSDGSYADVVSRGHLIYDEYGQVARMVGGLADVSERRRAQQEFVRQAALLDQASDAILVRSLDNRLLYLNRKSVELYGWSIEEALGRSVEELFYESGESLAAATESVLMTGEWSGEIEQRTRAGKTLRIFGRWTLMREADGQPESILAINTDITEKSRLESQLLHSQRMESIGTLASGIAHDLNNVLAPILMSVELLREQAGHAGANGLLETLRQCAQRGSDLVRQILTVARPEQGEVIRFAPAEIISEVVQVLHETLPKNIDVAWHRSAQLQWTLQGDPTQLHQLLMNLCLNARDAMPGGGWLTITLEEREVDQIFASMNLGLNPGPYLVIRVQDTGEGIPAHIQDRIFEPFFTTKSLGHGTGLGLATCFMIVKSHGGKILLESDQGRGACFEVFLPASQEHAESAEVSSHESSPLGQGQLLLLVDDEDHVREVIGTALERFGYRVLTASNGAQGVLAFARHKDDIAAVISDMSMPIMDGPTMMAALRAISPEVPVVASSGLRSQALAISAGAKVFLAKPYSVGRLLSTLSEVLAPSTGPHMEPHVSNSVLGETVMETSFEASDTESRSEREALEEPASGSIDVLIVEDEELVAALATRVLRADGYRVHTAVDGPGGIALFREHQARLGLVICDLELPVLDGEEVFRETRRQGSRVPFLLTTGQGALPAAFRAEANEGHVELLSKPYSIARLRERVRALLTHHCAAPRSTARTS